MIPLAEKQRPSSLTDFVGQQHLGALKNAIQKDNISSMIMWGPSGSGKTTLARIIAKQTNANFIELSAVVSGVKEIRQVIEDAKSLQNISKKTIIFIDEIHHFNKSQQDILLPHIEYGLITLIGATTENPAFELNTALLSRVSVYILNKLSNQELSQILDKVIKLRQNDKDIVIDASHGDCRKLLNIVEKIQQESPQNIADFIGENVADFDKGGDIYYQQLSALHKSIRGSSADGGLYWFARLITSGCSAKIIARRLLAIASEDIGLADPRALQITLNAWDIYHRVGAKEGNRAIAEAVVYCAIAPKSNAVYLAFNSAIERVKNDHSKVPKHLCNAVSDIDKAQNIGVDYRYSHNEDNAISIGQKYFPDEVGELEFYQPVDRGLEIKIKEKLRKIRDVK